MDMTHTFDTARTVHDRLVPHWRALSEAHRAHKDAQAAFARSRQHRDAADPPTETEELQRILAPYQGAMPPRRWAMTHAYWSQLINACGAVIVRSGVADVGWKQERLFRLPVSFDEDAGPAGWRLVCE